MFGNAFGWPHLLIILVVVLLLFGATRLPALSRSIAQSVKIFRKEVSTDQPGTTGTVADGSTDGEPGAAAPGGSAKKPAKPSGTSADKS